MGTFALWRIDSARDFVERVGDAEKAERELEKLLRHHQSSAISALQFGELVSTDPERLRYAAAEAEMLAGLQAAARPLGIQVTLVGIRRLGVP